MAKKALITGITGQIGSYLAENLLDHGREVHGLVRATSTMRRERIDHLQGIIKLHYGDLTDTASIGRIIREVKPDEVYNLGAQSHVHISFTNKEQTANTDGLGALRICEEVLQAGGVLANVYQGSARVYQASTSELYGGMYDYPVNEETPFHPRSPYGAAKLFAFWIMRNFREAYNMFCSNGIVFNSESERRGENFVTRKITKAVAEFAAKGRTEPLRLGNLNAKRDWGHAADSADAMRRILEYEKPDDFVIATGQTQSVRTFAEMAFDYAGIPLKWRGEGLQEEGYDARTGKQLIEVDPRHFRPSEVNVLLGDASKARKLLGWQPTRTLQGLVEEMVEHDLKAI